MVSATPTCDGDGDAGLDAGEGVCDNAPDRASDAEAADCKSGAECGSGIDGAPDVDPEQISLSNAGRDAVLDIMDTLHLPPPV